MEKAKKVEKSAFFFGLSTKKPGLR